MTLIDQALYQIKSCPQNGTIEHNWYCIEPNVSRICASTRSSNQAYQTCSQDKLSTLTAIPHQFSRSWFTFLPPHRAHLSGKRFRFWKPCGVFLSAKHLLKMKVWSLLVSWKVVHVVTRTSNLLQCFDFSKKTDAQP